MKDVMVDLETLNNVPGGVIISIGAVAFDWRRGCLGNEFETAVDVMSSKMAGLTTSADTLKWWGQQSEEARKILQEAYDGGAPTLRAALLSFNGYLRQFGDDVQVWGNGSDFDNAFLTVAMRACDIEPAWKFWHNRCFRTLKNIVGREFYKLPMPEREGTHHNALDDAKYQAQCAMVLLEHLAELQSMYATIANAKAQPGTVYTDIPSALDVRYLLSTTKDIDENDALRITPQKLDGVVHEIRNFTPTCLSLDDDGNLSLGGHYTPAQPGAALPTVQGVDGAPKLDGALVPTPWPDGKSPTVPFKYPAMMPLSPELGTLVIPADRSKPAHWDSGLGDNTPIDLPVEDCDADKGNS